MAITTLKSKQMQPVTALYRELSISETPNPINVSPSDNVDPAPLIVDL